MEPDRSTLFVSGIQDKSISNRVQRLFNFLRQQDRGNRWALSDNMVITIPGKPDTYYFKPIVRLLDNNTMELVSIPEAAIGRGNLRLLPKYASPCWGYCGENQEVDVFNNNMLMGMDDSICNFTPFAADLASWCEDNYQKGKTEWRYVVDGRYYDLTVLVDNNPNKLDVFTQHSEDGTRQRRVLRLDAEEAKRMVIESDILSGLPQQKKDLLTPLFRVVDGENKQGTSLLINSYSQLYEQGTYRSEKYPKIFEQERALEEDRGNLNVDQALQLMSFAKPVLDDNYPYTTPIKIAV